MFSAVPRVECIFRPSGLLIYVRLVCITVLIRFPVLVVSALCAWTLRSTGLLSIVDESIQDGACYGGMHK